MFFIYLLSNQYINISGIFELPDRIISLETGLTTAQILQAKKDLHGKVFFMDGWIRILNVDKYNSYKNSPKNKIAFTKEMLCVPEKIKNIVVDTSIDTSIDTPINHKSEIINHKSGIKGGVGGFSNIQSIDEKVIKEIAEKYQVPEPFVMSKLDDMKNWLGANGKKYKDYRLALMNWVKKDAINILEKRKLTVNKFKVTKI